MTKTTPHKQCTYTENQFQDWMEALELARKERVRAARLFDPKFVEWKLSLTSLLAKEGFTHALTLTWNKHTSLRAATSDLKLLHGMVDEALLGQRYHKMPFAMRTPALFVFEGVSGHIHVHSHWKLPQQHLFTFARLFPENRGGLWNEIVSSGSYELALINDPMTFSGYLLKWQHPNSPPEEMIWSRDFLRAA